MIKNLTSEEILDYLMTSEFNEGLTPDEFKFLLLQFRYFYRLQNGKNENLKNICEDKIKEIEECKKIHQQNINYVLIQKANLENQLNNLKFKKLTWKERFSGKLNITNDGTEGI